MAFSLGPLGRSKVSELVDRKLHIRVVAGVVRLNFLSGLKIQITPHLIIIASNIGFTEFDGKAEELCIIVAKLSSNELRGDGSK